MVLAVFTRKTHKQHINKKLITAQEVLGLNPSMVTCKTSTLHFFVNAGFFYLQIFCPFFIYLFKTLLSLIVLY